MTFLKYCEKSSRNIFLLFFLSEVAETQSLKIDLYYFFGKNRFFGFVLEFFGQKGPKQTQNKVF